MPAPSTAPYASQPISLAKTADTPDEAHATGTRTFLFGPFLFQPERQLLLKVHRPVRIGGRALDLLTRLVERPGEVVSKKELFACAWPETCVDEANLKVNIAGLRRVLGESADAPRFIATVNGRGYRFVAPVEARVLDMVRTEQQSAFTVTPCAEDDWAHLRPLDGPW
ncbi:winged helix-turn-helix domain-containing protein [Hyphomonas sp. NPDC076900]|uniref:winged helix-turn-helix domain-containing protein n=1 Tax=unclassified Hyphomonas TaxID=2630699 RepID=UPI003D0623C8